ncbi:MAG: phosphatase PAP2 family protein [Desulfovibrionaceae bacterium]|nr:phosphatase PAP2 family protein [Desulfovibrionaceae bacterium]
MRMFFPVFLALMLSFPFSSFSRSDPPQVSSDSILDTSSILPPPPAFDSIIMENDRAQYEYGLTLRNTERGKQAKLDANLKNCHELFSEAFGYPINAEKTPEIYKLLKISFQQIDKGSARVAKRKYMRVRPFTLYNTNTCYAEDEEVLRHTGSYPSGHTATSWGYALLLAEINPGRREEILKRGYEMGQSRVICGYHWQSDVDAARVSSAGAVAVLHANPEFQKQMEKAKMEFATLNIQK